MTGTVHLSVVLALVACTQLQPWSQASPLQPNLISVGGLGILIEPNHEFITLRSKRNRTGDRACIQYRSIEEDCYENANVSLPYTVKNLKDGMYYVICVLDTEETFTHNLDSNCRITLTRVREANTVLLYKRTLPLLISIYCVSALVSFLLGYLIRQHIEAKKKRKKKKKKKRCLPEVPPRPLWTLDPSCLKQIISSSEQVDPSEYVDPNEIMAVERHSIEDRYKRQAVKDNRRKRTRSKSLPDIHPAHRKRTQIAFLKLLTENDYESICSGSYASIHTLAAKLSTYQRLESIYERLLPEEEVPQQEKEGEEEEEEKEYIAMKRTKSEHYKSRKLSFISEDFVSIHL